MHTVTAMAFAMMYQLPAYECSQLNRPFHHLYSIHKCTRILAKYSTHHSQYCITVHKNVMCSIHSVCCHGDFLQVFSVLAMAQKQYRSSNAAYVLVTLFIISARGNVEKWQESKVHSCKEKLQETIYKVRLCVTSHKEEMLVCR